MTSPQSAVFLAVAGELLRRGQRVRFRAEGGSMHPTIRGGEAILVEPVLPAHLKKGDVALYLSGRGITAHRLIAIREGSGPGPVFLARGDALGSADEPVEQEQILGKVVSVERDSGVIDLNSRRTRIVNTICICAHQIRRAISNHIQSSDSALVTQDSVLR